MKNKKYILGIFIVSLVLMIPLIYNFFYAGHDTIFHFANIDRIIDALSWDNLLVRQPLSLIANNFGYGTRFFYPPLPHLLAAYIGKILSLLSVSNYAWIGLRTASWLGLFFSGVTFYYLAKKIFKNEKVAFLGAIFYMSMPYHLSDIFIRDAFAEGFIFISIPLILLGLLEMLDGEYLKFYVCFTLGYVLAIYSHMAMTIYFTIILVLSFFIINYKKILTKKNIGYFLLSSVSILLFTAPFWVPMLEMKLLDYAIFIPHYMTAQGELFYNTLRLYQYFTFFIPFNTSINYSLGATITILIIVSIYFFIKKEYKDKTYLGILIFFIISLVMTTGIFFLWLFIPDFLATLQFPWRLVAFVSFGGVLLSMYPLMKLVDKPIFKKVFIGLIIICLVGALYRTTPIDSTLASEVDYTWGTGWQKEYLPAKTINNLDYYENRTEDVYILTGEGDITITLNETPDLTFTVANASDDLVIELPRLFYPGYELTLNGEEIELTESEYGFLSAKISEDGEYELIYVGTTWFKVADALAIIITVIHVGVLVIIVIKRKIKKLS